MVSCLNTPQLLWFNLHISPSSCPSFLAVLLESFLFTVGFSDHVVETCHKPCYPADPPGLTLVKNIPPHIRGYRQKLDEKAWFTGIPLMDYYDDQPMDYTMLTKTLVFPNISQHLAFGKRLHSLGKSQFFKAKSTINCHIQFDSIAT